MTQNEIIQNHIKPRMKERGLTNYKLAKISGINRSTIGRYLEGSLNISLDNFLIIVKALGLDINIKSKIVIISMFMSSVIFGQEITYVMQDSVQLFITATGGKEPYEYEWISPFGTSFHSNKLTIRSKVNYNGIYKYIIKDDNGAHIEGDHLVIFSDNEIKNNPACKTYGIYDCGIIEYKGNKYNIIYYNCHTKIFKIKKMELIK